MQQHLPFTVLKPIIVAIIRFSYCIVATALTVYGIETSNKETFSSIKSPSCNSTYRLRYWNAPSGRPLQSTIWPVATALTVYGIETLITNVDRRMDLRVATALTVYGIETCRHLYCLYWYWHCCNSTYRLRYWNE